MFRIVRDGDFYQVLVQRYKKVWWFFGKIEWDYFEFEKGVSGEYVIFDSYHEALQKLLIAIERELNLAYMDNHEMRN